MKTKKIWILIWLISLLTIFIVTLINTRPYLLMGGSSSVAPLMEELMAKYPDNHKEVDYNYISSASAGAPPRVANDLFGVGWLSKDYHPDPNDKNLFSFQMMTDGLVIVYNLPDSAFIDGKPQQLNFTPGIVQDLYLHNKSWSDIVAFKKIINPNVKVQTFTRPNGSGTRDVFDDLVLGNPKTATNANTIDSSSAMLNIEPGGIGYSSFGDLAQAKSIVVQQGTWQGKEAKYDTIGNGDYKLTRPFTGLINKNFPNPKPVAAILNWIFSDATNSIFEKYGPKVERNAKDNKDLDTWLTKNGF